MIPIIVQFLLETMELEGRGFGFLRPLSSKYVEFRAIVSIVLSFTIVMLFGRRVIRWLVTKKIGDNPVFYNKTLEELMREKSNTPTMGGILMSSAIAVVILLLADIRTTYLPMAMICLIWLTGVGLWDDWLKLTTARRKPGSREGLYSWEKLVLQLGLAVVLGIFIYHRAGNKLTIDPLHTVDMSRSLNLPFLRSWVFDAAADKYVPSATMIVLALPVFALFATLVITFASNAVNLTDGMDGLASGITAIVAFALLILCLIAGREEWAKPLLVPYVPESGELAVVAGAILGACIGFLWFNCNPAAVFMGDTGSLSLGGLLGFMAVVIRQEFLLGIIGGVFVLEAMSVVLQVGWFKITKRRHGNGRRLFKMAPIHHHFHLKGWTEQQVVVRFWVITVILAAVALATIRLR